MEIPPKIFFTLISVGFGRDDLLSYAGLRVGVLWMCFLRCWLREEDHDEAGKLRRVMGSPRMMVVIAYGNGGCCCSGLVVVVFFLACRVFGAMSQLSDTVLAGQ